MLSKAQNNTHGYIISIRHSFGAKQTILLGNE